MDQETEWAEPHAPKGESWPDDASPAAFWGVVALALILGCLLSCGLGFAMGFAAAELHPVF